MSSNFNNAKIINVYYNKGDRKPYDVNGKPIAYIGEEAIGATEATTIRFYLGEDLDSSTAVIVTKRPDGERRLDLCEKFGTGVNSYYQVTLNSWYGAVKGKATLAFKVYNGSVVFDDNETPTEIISVEGRIVVSDIFNLEIAYAPEADLIVPADDTPDYVEWFAALSTKLDKAQSITVTGALPTLTGGVYDDRYFYVENEGVGKLWYIDGSTAIEVVWQVGTLRLTPTGNGNNTADTGKLSWNQPNGTVNVGLYNDVNIGVGEDVIYYVKATGAITKGDVIQYAGFQGDHALAKRAVQSEINANPKLIMGIAKQNIANGEFGYVAHFGKLEGVDTKGFGVDSFVWFDSAGSTAGNWTTTQPTAPNAKILLAVIIKAESSSEANNGILLVRPTIEPKLEELQNVLITSVANGNVLSYDGTKWVNSTRLTTAESNITNLQGRMTTEEANVDNLQGRMTSAEGDIDDIESGATIVPRALGDQNGNTINTTYLTQSSASATYIPLSQKAQANGVATLGADGKVIPSQIPGIVSSVEEYDTLEDFPEVGVLTTVYLALDTGLTYLWSGSGYVALSSSLALGETSTTAYRGDRGKIAYDYSQVGHLPLAGGTITNNLVVNGNFTVSGTTTTIDTETIGIKDNIILINSNQTGTPSTALKGGLEIERGDLTNFQFVFDENDDRFKVGQVGSLQTVATRTDDGTIANRGITFFNTSTNRLENNANIVIDSDNRVGIGTASPASDSPLHIRSSSVGIVRGRLKTTATTANPEFISVNDQDLTSATGIYGSTTSSYGTILTNQAYLYTNSTAINIASDNPSGLIKFGVGTGIPEKMRITANGNVGIGTTSPVAPLQIATPDAGLYQRAIKLATGSTDNGSGAFIHFPSGTNDAFGSFFGGGREGAGSASFFKFETTNASSIVGEKMRITSDGNVGIGTTSPNDQLEIKNNSGAFMSLNVSAAGSNATPKPAGLYYRGYLNNRLGGIVMDDRTGSISDSGPMIFYNNTNMLNDTLTERMRIASNGRVGIGTTSPGASLEVFLTSGETFRLNTGFGGGNTVDLNPYIAGVSNAGFSISLGQTVRQVITSSGNVGIGTTSPGQKLEVVHSNPNYENGLWITNSSDWGYGSRLTFRTPLTSGGAVGNAAAIEQNYESSNNFNMLFQTTSGGTMAERMRITSTGNVGIGTTTPSNKLNIVLGAGANAPTSISKANAYLGLGQTEFNTNSYRMIGFGYSSTGNSHFPAYIGYQETSNSGETLGDLIFHTRNVTTDTLPSERMRITSAGNVGIGTGTASPNYLLEVNGIAKFDGTPSNAQTGDYTLVLADKGKVLRINSSSNRTVTIPLNSSVAFPIDTEIAILRYGSGTVSISPTSGVTLNSKNSERKISGQYGSVALKKIGTDEWVLVGSLEA